MMKKRRPYYRQFSEGLRISEGQIIKYPAAWGANRHVYFLKSLAAQTAGANVNFGLFEVLNPTTYILTASDAVTVNPTLLLNDTLHLIDEGRDVENPDNVALLYSTLLNERYHASPKGTIIFEAGENQLQHYELNNRYQEPLATSFWATQFKSVFSLQVVACPDDFTGFVKVVNMTEFEDIRVTYPTVGTASVEVQMTYPAGITVTATYDTASSYTNTGTIGDFFYLEFTRTGGGNLVVVKHPINTIP